MPDEVVFSKDENYFQQPSNDQGIEDNIFIDDDVTWVRSDVDGLILDRSIEGLREDDDEDGDKDEDEWNEHGQPVGDGSTILSSYIGVVARSCILPLCIDDWRHIDREVKTRVIEHLKARFDLEGDKDLRWTLNKLGERWRNFKHRLFWDYVASMSRRDALTNCPPHQKNHPQGVVPSRHELWKLIRTCKNGEPMNEYYHQIFAAIDECVIRMEERNDGEVSGMEVPTGGEVMQPYPKQIATTPKDGLATSGGVVVQENVQNPDGLKTASNGSKSEKLRNVKEEARMQKHTSTGRAGGAEVSDPAGKTPSHRLDEELDSQEETTGDRGVQLGGKGAGAGPIQTQPPLNSQHKRQARNKSAKSGSNSGLAN
ncbi:hypothetical protein QJS10_CPA02g01071 [Acorus calamus]|uniref:Uncharacterized protein n=1 Tax=Acorus calamus TaxID=4465 RepID=A0AAV9FDY8_ACOCL|nr:hypothetical protein QJS10_CPA02g01071 [Acorus calamus]